MPKFNRQILSTVVSFYISDRRMTGMNVMTSFCALNLQIIFAVLKHRLLHRREIVMFSIIIKEAKIMLTSDYTTTDKYNICCVQTLT